MRWGRGFFRIWIVLSVLWIAATVYAYEPKTYAYPWRAAYELNFEGQPVSELNLRKSAAEISADLLAAMQSFKPDLSRAEIQKDRDQLLARLLATREAGNQGARKAWLATVVPPVLLFCFGLCIGWIVRGFRDQH